MVNCGAIVGNSNINNKRKKYVWRVLCAKTLCCGLVFYEFLVIVTDSILNTRTRSRMVETQRSNCIFLLLTRMHFSSRINYLVVCIGVAVIVIMATQDMQTAQLNTSAAAIVDSRSAALASRTAPPREDDDTPTTEPNSAAEWLAAPATQLSTSSSSPSSSSPAEFCRLNCQDARCYLPLDSDGVCVANPFYSAELSPAAAPQLVIDASSSHPFLDAFKKETAWMFPAWVDWAPPSSARLTCDYSLSSLASPQQQQQQLPPPMRGAHGSKMAPYKLENFCLRPRGRLAGYSPQMGQFLGATESFGVNDIKPELGMQRFLSDVENLDRDDGLQSVKRKAPCFVDVERLVLFPVTVHSDNAGHAFYRAGSLLRFIQSVFGDDAIRQNVTVVYVVTHRAPSGSQRARDHNISDNNRRRSRNAAILFYDIVGTSHFAVEYDEQVLGQRLRSHEKQQDATLMMCFRSAYVWHDIHTSKALLERRTASAAAATEQPAPSTGSRKRSSKLAPNSQSAAFFPLFARRRPKDVDTVNLLNDLIRAKHHLAPRRSAPNARHPHVVFSARSASRRFVFQPYIIARMAEFVRTELHGTFQVVENSRSTSISDIVAIHSKADVLIGMLGAGLIWTHFMPPGAVLVEINFRGHRSPCAAQSGIDPRLVVDAASSSASYSCDFGGATASSHQYHLVLANHFEPLIRFPYAAVVRRSREFRDAGAAASGTSSTRRAKLLEAQSRRLVGAYDLAAGADMFEFALKRASCVLSAGKSNNTSACDFSQTDVDAVARRSVEDESGENLAASFRVVPVCAFSSSSSVSNLHKELMSRRRALVDIGNRKWFSAALRPLRLRSANKIFPPETAHLQWNTNNEDKDADRLEITTVLLVLDAPVPRTPPETSGAAIALLNAELDGWRNVLQYTFRIMVIDDRRAKSAQAGPAVVKDPSWLPGVSLLCRYPCDEVRGQFDLIVSSGGNNTKSSRISSRISTRFRGENGVVLHLT